MLRSLPHYWFFVAFSTSGLLLIDNMYFTGIFLKGLWREIFRNLDGLLHFWRNYAENKQAVISIYVFVVNPN